MKEGRGIIKRPAGTYEVRNAFTILIVVMVLHGYIKTYELHNLNMCNLSYAGFTSVKLFFFFRSIDRAVREFSFVAAWLSVFEQQYDSHLTSG